MSAGICLPVKTLFTFLIYALPKSLPTLVALVHKDLEDTQVRFMETEGKGALSPTATNQLS